MPQKIGHCSQSGPSPAIQPRRGLAPGTPQPFPSCVSWEGRKLPYLPCLFLLHSIPQPAIAEPPSHSFSPATLYTISAANRKPSSVPSPISQHLPNWAAREPAEPANSDPASNSPFLILRDRQTAHRDDIKSLYPLRRFFASLHRDCATDDDLRACGFVLWDPSERLRLPTPWRACTQTSTRTCPGATGTTTLLILVSCDPAHPWVYSPLRNTLADPRLRLGCPGELRGC